MKWEERVIYYPGEIDMSSVYTLTNGNNWSPKSCFFSCIAFPSKEFNMALISIILVDSTGGATMGIAFDLRGGMTTVSWTVAGGDILFFLKGNNGDVLTGI